MEEKICIHDADFETEIVGVLFAISVVAKRLATKLNAMQQKQGESTERGDENDTR